MACRVSGFIRKGADDSEQNGGAGSRPEGRAMRDLLIALALMLAMEGLAFAAFPGAMRRAMRDAAETPEGVLRWVGIASAIVGIVLVWAIRGFPAINLL
jgi:uncharacterized protein